MTEEEAKTKWCPMVRINGNAMDYILNRKASDRHSYCIGSACMMWRENVDYLPGPHGYCGLAGKP